MFYTYTFNTSPFQEGPGRIFEKKQIETLGCKERRLHGLLGARGAESQRQPVQFMTVKGRFEWGNWLQIDHQCALRKCMTIGW